MAVEISVDDPGDTGPATTPLRVPEAARTALREPLVSSRGVLLQPKALHFLAGGVGVAGSEAGGEAGAAAAAKRRPLERLGKNVATKLHGCPDEQQEQAVEQALRDRFRILTRGIWRDEDEDALAATRRCCRYSRLPGGGTTVRIKDGIVGLAGVVHCGSGTACPRCGAVIAARRAEEVQRGIRAALAEGNGIMLWTLTLQHFSGQALQPTYEAVMYGLRKIRQSSVWRSETEREYMKRLVRWEMKPGRRRRPERRIGVREQLGIIGDIRVVEVPFGDENGWHPHLHLLLFTETPVSQERAEQLLGRLFPVWQDAVRSKGYDALKVWRNEDGTEGGALHVTTSAQEAGERMAEYFTKSVSLELTQGNVTKKGRRGGRTPFRLAYDAYVEGDDAALDRWHEWVRVSKGRQQLVWSDGLKDRFGIKHVEDQALVDEEDQIQSDNLVFLPEETREKLAYDQAEFLIAIRRGAKISDAEGLRACIAYLEVAGLAWTMISSAEWAELDARSRVRKRDRAPD